MSRGGSLLSLFRLSRRNNQTVQKFNLWRLRRRPLANQDGRVATPVAHSDSFSSSPASSSRSSSPYAPPLSPHHRTASSCAQPTATGHPSFSLQTDLPPLPYEDPSHDAMIRAVLAQSPAQAALQSDNRAREEMLRLAERRKEEHSARRVFAEHRVRHYLTLLKASRNDLLRTTQEFRDADDCVRMLRDAGLADSSSHSIHSARA